MRGLFWILSCFSILALIVNVIDWQNGGEASGLIPYMFFSAVLGCIGIKMIKNKDLFR